MTKNGLVWYESEGLDELGIKHGFYTRLGGVSQNEYQSLNVKYEIGDDSENIDANREKILKSIGVNNLSFAKLVHGTDFAEIESITDDQQDIENIDAIITSQKGAAIALSVADCLPIIISDGKLAAVIHAGWRGTVELITDKIVKVMIERGLNIEKAVAVTGPYICKKHFEVEGDSAIQLRELAGAEQNGENYHADILELNIQQLRANGIKNTDSLDMCSTDSTEWFSYRRDQGKTGRNMVIAVLS